MGMVYSQSQALLYQWQERLTVKCEHAEYAKGQNRKFE
jgi:hypothetical protein